MPDFDYKILAPRVQRNAVERTQVLASIAQSNARVVVFQGPAGHGKTSLMLQVDATCRAKNWPCGWLSLDNSDNDLGSFRRHLRNMITAMKAPATLDRKAEHKLDLDEAQLGSPIDWALTELVTLGGDVAIFLDDLHTIDGAATQDFLREMLAAAPPRIHWFLASRHAPELGLPRLIVGDEALVIDPQSLRFSRSELEQFFAQDCTPPLREAEVDALFVATEGWPAAAQLYRLALRSGTVRQSLRAGQSTHLRELSGYLAENVLAQQRPAVQSFLLQTSMLERLSAEQCDALLERHDSAEILDELEHLGLFVRRLESQQGWFSYHALFSQFLRHQLQISTPDALVQMHGRAAIWCRQHRDLEGALHHSIVSTDYQTACEVFDEWAEILILDGYLATVDHWSSQIPTEVLADHPSLVAKIVWALTFLSRHRRLEPLLPIVRKSIGQTENSIDHSIALCMVAVLEDDLAGSLAYIAGIDVQANATRRFRTFGYAAVANVRGYAAMAKGQFDEALKYLSLGRTLAERADAGFPLSYAMAKVGITLVAQGQLREAVVHLRAAISDPRVFLEESISTMSLACALIMALYEAGETEPALELFGHYRGLIAGAGLHDYLVICYRVIVRIHDLKNEPDIALEMLEEAERCAFVGQWPRAVDAFGWERVRRELLAGQIERAQAIAKGLPSVGNVPGEAVSESWIQFSDETEDPIIGGIRLLIHTQRFAPALDAIAAAQSIAVEHKRVARQIKLHVLAALAFHGKNDERRAQRNMHLAAGLAAHGRFVRAFLDEGVNVLTIVQSILRQSASAPVDAKNASAMTFLRELISIAGAQAPEANYFVQDAGLAAKSSATKLHPADALTKKEAIVLGMIVNYMSNDQIAQNLFVSRDTVKYHIKNIYGKLGVKSRLESIRVAAKMGIVGGS